MLSTAQTSKTIKSISKRLEKYTDRNGPPSSVGGSCWTWTKATHPRSGYGYMWVGGKNRIIHRVSYEFFKGPIPLGLSIDHLCRNTSCVNPDHLEAVPIKENIRRGGNAIKTHCANGHEYTEENTSFYSGQRHCRICSRQWTRNYRARLLNDGK